jgi:DNA-directed RNA polymerase specialized sigma24 family protein
VASYTAGAHIPNLVERFQADQTTIQKYVRRAGLPRRIRRVPPTKVEEVIRLYCSGNSVDAIAERLEVAPTTVRRTLAKASVPLRRRRRPSKG